MNNININIHIWPTVTSKLRIDNKVGKYWVDDIQLVCTDLE